MIQVRADPSFGGREITCVEEEVGICARWPEPRMRPLVFQRFHLVGAASGGHKRLMSGRLFHHGFDLVDVVRLFFARERAFAIRALDRLGMAGMRRFSRTDTLLQGRASKTGTRSSHSRWGTSSGARNIFVAGGRTNRLSPFRSSREWSFMVPFAQHQSRKTVSRSSAISPYP